MEVVFDEEGLRQDFEAESIPNLVDYWDEMMHAAERAILLEVLTARRYRVKSLPSPPANGMEDLVEQQALLATEALADEKKMAKDIRRGARGLLALGLFCLLYGFVYNEKTAKDLPSGKTLEIGESAVNGPTFFFAIGISFFLLFFWSRAKPVPAFSVATLLWLAALALHFTQGTGMSIGPILLAGIPLAIGFSGAIQARKEERRQADEYYY